MHTQDKVWGVVVDFKHQVDANKFLKDYDNQWFLFDTKEEREKWYKYMIHEAHFRYGACDVSLFSSTGKTPEELEDWIVRTFIDYNHNDI